ncbi:ParB/RepB/Spo0J family partition protein [Sinomonas humi]|uniref:ParB-like N-terminal domain-containing protein n=1 Tax=Sinomonas humi TaxID=1338436 RepID=A0A0B2APJ1_9MICC|nr:ParB N-terminal domain-containing protein [Sinomonas humi]KHL05332.1 hypothetical protein LK10_01545 [Sinomonas humi]
MSATLVYRNPADLLVDTNVRTTADLTPAFVASIKEHGVLQPITAYTTDEGERVFTGHRRTLAAIDAGRETIPVILGDTPEEADRLAKQLVENDQRAGLTENDRAEAFHQMALLGVSAAQIAKKTATPKATVEKAIEARKDETATARLDAGYTVEQALVLAEFDADPAALERIEDAISEDPDMLAHVAQQLRDDRKRAKEEAAELAALTAELEAKGLTVVERIGWNSDHEAVGLPYLTDAEGNQPSEDAANAVAIGRRWNAGLYTEYGITGWAEEGYTAREPYRAPGREEKPTGPWTEEQKAERRTLIANNRAMESATTVRHEWVKSLLARKNPPKDWTRFLATAHTAHHAYAGERNTTLAEDFAGCPDTSDYRRSALAEWTAAHPARPHVPLLALAIASFERYMPKDAWRDANAARRFYLSQLAAWGYKLSDVEAIITAVPEASAKEQGGAEPDDAA